MSKVVAVGNKFLKVNNETGTYEVVGERPLEKTEIRKEADGWHVTFTGEPKETEK